MIDLYSMVLLAKMAIEDAGLVNISDEDKLRTEFQ